MIGSVNMNRCEYLKSTIKFLNVPGICFGARKQMPVQCFCQSFLHDDKMIVFLNFRGK